MAISTNSVFEVRTAGADTNGGGFVTGAAGTDFSQQDTKNTVGSNISTTDAVAVGTGVITSVTAAFTAEIVGNIIYLQGGTGALAAGWYQVTVFTNATTITVDRNVAAGTGITMNIGGALGSPGGSGGVGIATGHIIHVKAATYTITSATPNISGGTFQTSAATFAMVGYQTVRGDYGTQPLFQASGIATFVLVQATGANSSVQNISVDGAGLASSRGFSMRGLGFKLHAANCTNNAYVQTSDVIWQRCTATGCSAVLVFSGGTYVNCVAYNNSFTGFSVNQAGKTAVRCLSVNNTGATSDGFVTTSEAGFINCVAYGNGRDGFRISEDVMSIINCIAESNVGIGFDITANNDNVLFSNNATFGNGTAFNLGSGKNVVNLNAVAGVSSFFTNAAGNDFSLNNTAGAGAAARNAAYPGTLAFGGTGYLDIGALQHQDAGGGPPYIIGG